MCACAYVSECVNNVQYCMVALVIFVYACEDSLGAVLQTGHIEEGRGFVSGLEKEEVHGG